VQVGVVLALQAGMIFWIPEVVVGVLVVLVVVVVLLLLAYFLSTISISLACYWSHSHL